MQHPLTRGARGVRWLGRWVAGRWARHPRLPLAVRGSVAAALAWFVGVLAPAPFSDYPYYAPLGAVVASSSTLVRSVRESLQATAAILLGAVIARAVDLVLAPSALSVAVVVGLALLCSGWRVLGDMGTWAATAALFVLIVGEHDELGFVGAFVGLVAAGAAIGVLVILAFPTLPLTPSDIALDRLRDTLVEQLDALAEGLEGEQPPSREEWEDRRRVVEPTLARARHAVWSTREAARANRRARRYRARTSAQVARAARLGTAADAVHELTRLLVEWERRGRDDLALGGSLRPAASRTLRAYSAALRASDGLATDDDAHAHLREATGALRVAVRRARTGSEHDYFVAGALVLAVRRGEEALEPAQDPGGEG